MGHSRTKPWACFCIFVFSIILLLFAPPAYAQSKTLHYLNIPESVRVPGIIGQGVILPGAHARIFFHFANKTSGDLTFKLSTDEMLKNHKSSLSTEYFPGDAGSKAVSRFLWDHSIASPARIDLSQVVKPGWTISGIVEGDATKVTSYVASLGDGPVVPGMVTLTSNLPEWCSSFTLLDQQTKRILIGEKHSGIDGDYGCTDIIQIKSGAKVARKLKITISPRGGSASVPYTINNNLRNTGLLQARSKNVIYCPINPGETLTFTTIPAGGFNYPVRIEVSLSPV